MVSPSRLMLNSWFFGRFRRFLLCFYQKMVAVSLQFLRRYHGLGDFKSVAGLATRSPNPHH